MMIVELNLAGYRFSGEIGPIYATSRCDPRGSVRGQFSGEFRSFATRPPPDGRPVQRNTPMSLATHAPRKRGDTRTRC